MKFNEKEILAHTKVPHARVMQELADKHSLLAGLIDRHPVHYVDVPFYENIGDLLIMKGTLSFFEKHHINVTRKACFFNYSAEWAEADSVLVFQGGGNFGDLYPGPQQLREKCVSLLKGNRIIILPQTIHFSDPRVYEDCCKLMSTHPDLHICVRDQRSFELASAMTKHVYLLPDMAHQLWPIERGLNIPTAPQKILGIFRTDNEKLTNKKMQVNHLTDWPELVGKRKKHFRSIQKVLRALHLMGVDKALSDKFTNLWIKHVDQLIEEAETLFSNYQVIHTDRLHGHILACLMNKENIVFDNSYGKNASYIEAWTGASQKVNTHLK